MIYPVALGAVGDWNKCGEQHGDSKYDHSYQKEGHPETGGAGAKHLSIGFGKLFPLSDYQCADCKCQERKSHAEQEVR